jgi:hypothetical protein
LGFVTWLLRHCCPATRPLLEESAPDFSGWNSLPSFQRSLLYSTEGLVTVKSILDFFSLTALSGVVIILPGAVRASRAEKFFFFADAETSKGIVFRADSIFLNKSSIFFIDICKNSYFIYTKREQKWTI